MHFRVFCSPVLPSTHARKHISLLVPAKTRPSHNLHSNLKPSSRLRWRTSLFLEYSVWDHMNIKINRRCLRCFFSGRDFRRRHDYKRGESSSMSKQLQFRQPLSERYLWFQKIIRNTEMWFCFHGMFDKRQKKWINTHLPKTTSETRVASRPLLNDDSSLVFRMRSRRQ